MKNYITIKSKITINASLLNKILRDENKMKYKNKIIINKIK